MKQIRGIDEIPLSMQNTAFPVPGFVNEQYRQVNPLQDDEDRLKQQASFA